MIGVRVVRFVKGFAKMAPGTMGGQSRIASKAAHTQRTSTRVTSR